jgi:hypothetical protein
LSQWGLTMPAMRSLTYRSFINRDLPQRERACESKAVFISRREARSLIAHGRRVDGGLRPYRCRFCAGWHLGHRRTQRPR